MHGFGLRDWFVSFAVAATGAVFVYAYGYTARRRWRVEFPDLVTMIAYRAKPVGTWPLKEQLLYTLLTILRFFGFILIALGVGAPFYAMQTGRSIW